MRLRCVVLSLMTGVCVATFTCNALAQEAGQKFLPLDRKSSTVFAARKYHINKVDGNIRPSTASHRFYPEGMKMPATAEPRRGDTLSELQPQAGPFKQAEITDPVKSSLILSLYANEKNKLPLLIGPVKVDDPTPLRDQYRVPMMQ